MNIDELNSKIINVDNSHQSLNLNTEMEFINLPRDNEPLNKEKEEEKGEAEKNLMFGVKRISPFRLYCHISGNFEIFLMIVGSIFTIGAGCSGALISLLLGDTINDFTSTSEIEDLPDDEYNNILDKVEPSINDMTKKFLIIGAIMFVCNFFMMFSWAYSSLRQMHWMKINYFSLILKQEQGWFDENNAFEFATKVFYYVVLHL